MTMATSHSFCKHDPDSFCYGCGIFISAKSVKHTIFEGNLFCAAFYACFGVQVGDQDKDWALHVICGNCRSTLEVWYREESRRMNFGVPRIWREPTNHLENCNFCKVVVAGHHRGKKTDVSFDYSDLPSSLRPVKHYEELPVPNFLVSVSRDSSNIETDDDIPYIIIWTSLNQIWTHTQKSMETFPSRRSGL